MIGLIGLLTAAAAAAFSFFLFLHQPSINPHQHKLKKFSFVEWVGWIDECWLKNEERREQPAFAKSIFNFIQLFISFKEKWKCWWNEIEWRCLFGRQRPVIHSSSFISFNFHHSFLTFIRAGGARLLWMGWFGWFLFEEEVGYGCRPPTNKSTLLLLLIRERMNDGREDSWRKEKWN